MADRKIRLAALGDCASILEIYAPFITNTDITFEYQVPTIVEFENRMANIQKRYPWLVYEYDKRIIGYAYASQYNEREAYDWSVDFSIYIDPKHHGKGIGRALYFCLSELLRLQGFCNAYAGVALPNPKSEGFHEAFGFKPVGIYRKVGYKHGKWRDVRWYSLDIADHIPSPAKPNLIDEIRDTPEFTKIIQESEQMIRD